MPDLEKLSRPLRRVLAEWLSRLVDRLMHLQYQLRYGLIHLISSSVAETIEDQLHRPFGNSPRRENHEDEYLDYDEPPIPRLAYPTGETPPESSDSWRNVIMRAAQKMLQWLQKPWVEPLLAGCVTLVSLLFFVG